MITSNLTISSLLFNAYPQVTYWKIQLNATDSLSSGSNEIILKLNQLPTNGTCQVDILNGSALETNFTVKCSNWIDPDGLVYSFQYYG